MTTNALNCAKTPTFTAATLPKKHGLLAVIAQTILTWQERSSMRHQLAQLDQENLTDMGLTYNDISAELRKPFWQK